MASTVPNPRLRSALEAIIRFAGPGLDLVLVLGDCVSRVADRNDRGYALVRMEHDGQAAPRGLRPRSDGA